MGVVRAAGATDGVGVVLGRTTGAGCKIGWEALLDPPFVSVVLEAIGVEVVVVTVVLGGRLKAFVLFRWAISKPVPPTKPVAMSKTRKYVFIM